MTWHPEGRIVPYLTVQYLKLLPSELSAYAAELDYRKSTAFDLKCCGTIAGRVDTLAGMDKCFQARRGNRFPASYRPEIQVAQPALLEIDLRRQETDETSHAVFYVVVDFPQR